MSTASAAARNPGNVTVEWRPSVNPWMVALSVMLATFMVVLDSSVANVALPHIAGSLSASTDESTWVLTSYLVSNAVILPATGWLAARIGRQRASCRVQARQLPRLSRLRRHGGLAGS